jgi:uracil phosphoribosyltransferase
MPAHSLSHPLAACHLTTLRDRGTTPGVFRQAIRQLTQLVGAESTRNLETTEIQVETPICAVAGVKLNQRIGLVPILRAGIGMVDPMLDLIPSAEVWHLGLYRDEETATPVRYYSKLREDDPVDLALILDPMLATGGSASMACQALVDWGVKKINLISIIAAPEGIARLERDFPSVEIYTCAVDECLNEHFYIVPGLGDAGDRMFNTF